MAAADCRSGSSSLARAFVTKRCSMPHAGSNRYCTAPSATDPTGGDEMIYELRVYHCVPGRLPDLMKRFDTITLPLWEKHRIRQAGFWTVAIGSSNQDLYYMLQWETRQDG